MTFEDWADRNGIFGASVPVHLFRQCWEAAQKEALGEPVAWMVVNNDGQDCFVTADPRIADSGQRALPLHTGMRSN